jgi:hypothetical protein
MNSEESIDEQWTSIIYLKQEYFKDVYDEAGNVILPPLTSLFQQDDFANEVIPTSPRTLDPNNITSPLPPGAPSSFPVLIKQYQETLYQREFHPKQKHIWILLKRELLMRA